MSSCVVWGAVRWTGHSSSTNFSKDGLNTDLPWIHPRNGSEHSYPNNGVSDVWIRSSICFVSIVHQRPPMHFFALHNNRVVSNVFMFACVCVCLKVLSENVLREIQSTTPRKVFQFFKNKKLKYTNRESNPGQLLGRQLCYHYTIGANKCGVE